MSATALGDRARFGQRSWIGLVLERTIAVELELGEDGDRSAMRCAAAHSWCRRDRSSWWLAFGGSTAPIAAFMATKGGGRAGPAPPSAATAAEAKRRMARAGYFVSRCKAGLPGARKIAGRSHCRSGPLAASIALSRRPCARSSPPQWEHHRDDHAGQQACSLSPPCYPIRAHESRDVVRGELHAHRCP